MTTTREAALEAALQEIMSSDSYESRETFDGSNKHVVITKFGELGQIAHEALATPATDPQGYVEGLPIAGYMHGYPRNWGTCWEYLPPDRKDLSPLEWIPLVKLSDALAARPAPQPDHASDCATHNMPAYPTCPCDCSLPAPQPAADTRVVASLLDPNAVHLNMLRGTIAKPSVEQIRHIYGDVLTPAPSDKIAEAARRLLREAELDGMESKAGWDCWMGNLRRALAGKGE